MAANVKFNFLDSHGRSTSRSFHNVEALVADIIADVGELAALWAPLTDLQLVNAIMTFSTTTGAFAGAVGSNMDDNVSVQVLAGDGFKYDVDLPAVPDAKISGGVVALTDQDLIDFIAEFAGGAGNAWRVNLRNPTTIASVIKATLDK